jgi:four helix bundle protein
VFQLADRLVMEVYRLSKGFPDDERFGLVSQVRRASVSTVVNIVEGCAREKDGEYRNFLNIACGSASEVRYLLDLSRRLGYLSQGEFDAVEDPSDELVRSLQNLIASLRPAA